MMQHWRMHFFVSMGVETRCFPCHSAAHCRHMKRQHSFVIVATTMVVAIANAVAITVAIAVSLEVAVDVA